MNYLVQKPLNHAELSSMVSLFRQSLAADDRLLAEWFPSD
jgi:hypothetical protein